MSAMGDEYEVVVAGGGIAGLTAGLTSARLGRCTLVLTGGVPGGLLLGVDSIEGLAGFPEGVAGYELGPLVQDQAMAAGADFSMAELDGLETEDGSWRAGGVLTHAVIVATGSRLKEIGVAGEDRLRGSGVSHCASCDAPLVEDQIVGVVGGGDSACQEALTLAEFASRVMILHRGEALSAQSTYQRRVLNHPKIAIRYRTVVEEVLGDERVTSVKTRDLMTSDREICDIAALFVYVGLKPNTECVENRLRLTEAGQIPTDGCLRTDIPGIFAAGIVRSDSVGQAASASGDGVTAAIAADRYLSERSRSDRARSVTSALAIGNGDSDE